MVLLVYLCILASINTACVKIFRVLHEHVNGENYTDLDNAKIYVNIIVLYIHSVLQADLMIYL